ncbi:MAG: hypothetical protein K6T87_16160 [Roseiflexus sp.]|uniref:hypothetical protein n=1 Tax=Roseiflexus sp. TaxID=2562120 RepID=UPI0025E0AE12|nr:hypothetical protein [Roseiflexus sp.]MCL6542091.1 hypothetical protein [Roseiflexus sp.]
MISQELMETDWLISRIQSRIGIFLTLKDRIIRIRNTTLDLNLKTEAEGLLQKQLTLEKDLAEGLKEIENIKAGLYSISSILKLGTLYYEIEKQIREVDELEKMWAGAPRKEGLSTIHKILIAAAIGGAIFYFTK